MTRHGLLSGLLACALSAPAGAQVRLFMAADGEQQQAPPSGNTTLQIDPGTTAEILVWLEDTSGGQLLNGYQLILPDAAAALDGTGTLTYIDNNPGLGGGDSIVVDTTRSDWIFALEPAVLPPAYSESPTNGIFGVLYNTVVDTGVDPTDPADVPLPGGIHYLAGFEFAASADACADFELNFNLPPASPPHVALFLPTGGEFVVDEIQALTISTRPRPANDGCSQAVAVGDGSHPFSTLCATTDGPDQPGEPPAGCQQFAISSQVHNDVWFAYTSPCTGTLVASTCNDADYDSKIAVYQPGTGCPPDPLDLLDCNDGLFGCGATSRVEVPVTVGQAYLIRVGGSAEEDTGSGMLTLMCGEECTPGLPVNDPLTIQQCGDPGQCADVLCDAVEGCLFAPKGPGTPCSDDNDCTEPDVCNGAGACVSGPTVDCDDDDPCTLDNCLLVGGCVNTIQPGAPCDAGGGPGSGVCNDQGECTGCNSRADCADSDGDGKRDDVCVWWACQSMQCVDTALIYGDVGGPFGACPPDGTADNNDVFHVLNCFADQDTLGNPFSYPCEDLPPAAYNVDPAGQFLSCQPDGVCDVNDAFGVLSVFDGSTSCSCPPGGPGPEMDGAPTSRRAAPAVTEHAALSLQPSRRIMRPGQTVRVDVLLDGRLNDLRGYQLHVAARGGQAGSLEVVDVSIEPRPIAALAESDGFEVFNAHLGQMGAGLQGTGRPAGPAYLATFTLRAGSQARGTFAIELLHDHTDPQQRTFLFPTPPGAMIAIDRAVPARVTVLPPPTASKARSTRQR